MPRKEYFITREDFGLFLKSLSSEYAVFVPVEVEGKFRLEKFTPEEMRDIRMNPWRVTEPLKIFFFPPREAVAVYFDAEPEVDARKRILVGVKECDLAALRVLDYVFLEGDFQDPFYKARRENTIIISSDCSTAAEACFCAMYDSKPYPTEGFDLNVAEVEEGYVTTVGSDSGKKLVAGFEGFKDATKKQISERNKQRKALETELSKKAKDEGLKIAKQLEKAVAAKPEAEIWEKFAEQCVECGACNFVCPTCHCFLLVEVEEAGKFKRFKDWDSCQYAAFAKVAGGANPRKRRAERLRNRFEKKFDFFVRNLDSLACMGCGRCIEACPGKLDIREILKELTA